ncbi:hypothetical protein BD408DRAFT_419894 [Parasitella parasitica]|nr:hypothetical protein BD408DRAFT_419894 [Parasitella parasitica]
MLLRTCARLNCQTSLAGCLKLIWPVSGLISCLHYGVSALWRPEAKSLHCPCTSP